MKGWKEANFTIPKVGDLSVAVVSGLSNARQLMTDLEEGRVHYDFVEVMACPGGCAGGGGQPIHDGTEMAEARGNVLWNIDKKSPVRFSHENPEIQTPVSGVPACASQWPFAPSAPYGSRGLENAQPEVRHKKRTLSRWLRVLFLCSVKQHRHPRGWKG